jgi:hypothetical protein
MNLDAIPFYILHRLWFLINRVSFGLHRLVRGFLAVGFDVHGTMHSRVAEHYNKDGNNDVSQRRVVDAGIGMGGDECGGFLVELFGRQRGREE